ncbi:MAG: 3-isopropylmalate dehydratase small subunit [Bacteroidaceae bacterium]|nr:3-isopropylmalate dehydratase small subunit [Bacteroidaceae bacterium]
MEKKFGVIESTCLPIAIDNCNTDLIIPARYLASTTRDPKFFGDAFMHDLRYDANGNPVKDFILNQPGFNETPREGHRQIVVAGANWGSGSSREHAAWAISGYGIRVVVSSSFADIHRNNLLNCFVLPVVVSEEFRDNLLKNINTNPDARVKVDLPAQTITDMTTGASETFSINSYKKYCLMNGYDDIDYLMSRNAQIDEFEKNRDSRRYVEILDTTLRDGEQTSGVSFSSQEKLSIVQSLLSEVNVDRVEIASAMVSDREQESVRGIAEWAQRNGCLNRVEVLGFVDVNRSADWILATGCRVMNLLCKGSLKHVTAQLGKTPAEHIADILSTVEYAVSRGMDVNVYLEDWSNGMKDSPEYVFELTDALTAMPVKRIMLPDTLGILNPDTTLKYCSMMVERYPSVHFDFHAHNDYDLALSNVWSAVRAGMKGIHTTVNGLGERAGNAPLGSVMAVLKDQMGMMTGLNESRLFKVSRKVEVDSGLHIPHNMPLVGEFVFTQCAGVHADGDKKDNLYFNNLLPERFGRVREYALGKNSGKASIQMNLEAMGIELDEESMRKVTDRIIELGVKKEQVTQDDLPYIVHDVLHHEQEEQRIRILNYSLSLTQGLRPQATVKIEINGKVYQDAATGDGQYDAFVRALRKIYASLDKPFPVLTNYTVSIPPGGRTDAFVQTIITWNFKGEEFRTRGLDADQTEAAIKATAKMMNKIENL